MATRQQFIDAAFAYHKVRWRDEGRSKRGIDCAGLIICAAWDTGLLSREINPLGYLRMPLGFEFPQYFDKHMERKRLVDRRPGDVLLHRDTIRPCHCSILFERPGYGEQIIHSDLVRGDVTTDPLPGKWQQRAYPYCYQFDGFED